MGAPETARQPCAGARRRASLSQGYASRSRCHRGQQAVGTQARDHPGDRSRGATQRDFALGASRCARKTVLEHRPEQLVVHDRALVQPGVVLQRRRRRSRRARAQSPEDRGRGSGHDLYGQSRAGVRALLVRGTQRAAARVLGPATYCRWPFLRSSRRGGPRESTMTAKVRAVPCSTASQPRSRSRHSLGRHPDERVAALILPEPRALGWPPFTS